MYTIHWTATAEVTYQEEIEYILTKWPLKEAEKFVTLVEDTLQVVAAGAMTGKSSGVGNVKILIVSKQTSLAYKVFEKELRIEILVFWNNQIDPQRYTRFIKSS